MDPNVCAEAQGPDPYTTAVQQTASRVHVPQDDSMGNVGPMQGDTTNGETQSSPGADLRHSRLRSTVEQTDFRLVHAQRNLRSLLSSEQRKHLDQSLQVWGSDHSLEVLHDALRKGADPDQGYTDIPWLPLQKAIIRKHREAVNMFIRSGANLESFSACVTPDIWWQATPLQFAVYHGDVYITRSLLKACCGDISKSLASHLLTPDNGLGALLNIAAASSLANTDIIDLLLEFGADVNHTDPTHRTPLFSAVVGGFGPSGGRPRMHTWADSDLRAVKVRHLLAKGADPNFISEFDDTRHQQIMARIHGGKHPERYPILSILAECIGRHTQPREVRSAYNALKRKPPTYNTKILETLLAYGATPWPTDYLVVMQRDHSELLEYLLSKAPGKKYMRAQIEAHGWADVTTKRLVEAIANLDVDLVVALIDCGILEGKDLVLKAEILLRAVVSLAWRSFASARFEADPRTKSRRELADRGRVIALQAGRMFDALGGNGETGDCRSSIGYQKKTRFGLHSRWTWELVSPKELAQRIALGPGSAHVDRKMLFKFAYQ